MAAGREDLFSEEGDRAIRKCRRRRRLGCREKAENGSGSPKVGFVISILNTKEQLQKKVSKDRRTESTRLEKLETRKEFLEMEESLIRHNCEVKRMKGHSQNYAGELGTLDTSPMGYKTQDRYNLTTVTVSAVTSLLLHLPKSHYECNEGSDLNIVDY